MTAQIHHVAIEDDWEMSRAFGEYEVSTRGVPFDDTGFVHAVVAERVPDVVSARYADISLPLLDIALSVAGLEAAGAAVEWVDGAPRILAPIPMIPEVIISETPIRR